MVLFFTENMFLFSKMQLEQFFFILFSRFKRNILPKKIQVPFKHESVIQKNIKKKFFSSEKITYQQKVIEIGGRRNDFQDCSGVTFLFLSSSTGFRKF